MQVRQFLKSLGMKPCKVGQILAQADVIAQEDLQTEQREPRLEEAKSGQRVVFFMAAAHVVFAPFLGLVWCCEPLCSKVPSGRQRLNELAALHATTQDIFTCSYITSTTVCEFPRLLTGPIQACRAYPSGSSLSGSIPKARSRAASWEARCSA